MDSEDVFKLGVLALVVLVGLAIGWLFFVVIVPAGSVGVKDTFGVVDSDVFQPGLHLKNPFTGVKLYSTRTQKYYDSGSPGDSDVATIAALSNEGLKVSIGVAVNYHIDPSLAPDLYRNVGEEYQTIIMKPSIHAVPRDIISKYDVKTLYSARSETSTDRAKIEQEVYQAISRDMLRDGQSRGIVIEQVFIRNIDLPQTLMDSIEQKLKMEQQIAQKQFEVEVAKKEADRKIAEAYGIAEANKIISNSITDRYIQWYSIEMMKEVGSKGTTYFIPVGTDGRVHPDIVVPIATQTT